MCIPGSLLVCSEWKAVVKLQAAPAPLSVLPPPPLPHPRPPAPGQKSGLPQRRKEELVLVAACGWCMRGHRTAGEWKWKVCTVVRGLPARGSRAKIGLKQGRAHVCFV